MLGLGPLKEYRKNVFLYSLVHAGVGLTNATTNPLVFVVHQNTMWLFSQYTVSDIGQAWIQWLLMLSGSDSPPPPPPAYTPDLSRQIPETPGIHPMLV